MSKRRRELSEDEAELWRRVTARVKARARARAAAKLGAEAPPRAPAPAISAPSPSLSPRKPSTPKAPPADRGGEKRVRRGRLEIDATFDLHGHTQESGRVALGRFLAAAYRDGARTVVVVTGVGRMGEGVLRQRLPDWLAEAANRTIVSGFAQAHRQHGGSGAYYVFLKRRPE